MRLLLCEIESIQFNLPHTGHDRCKHTDADHLAILQTKDDVVIITDMMVICVFAVQAVQAVLKRVSSAETSGQYELEVFMSWMCAIIWDNLVIVGAQSELVSCGP